MNTLKLFLILPAILPAGFTFSQNQAKTDSIIQSVQSEKLNLDPNDKGVDLIKDQKYSEADLFFSNEINKNDLNREAYFNRGVARWELNDAGNACRDWSAVLALGDTATFKLLDSKCHGEMVIGEDTIHSKQYRKIFAQDKKDARTMSASSNAQNIADQMPEFPGGTEALYAYLKNTVRYPAAALKKNVQGRVYVNFVVSTKGKILFPYVVRGIGSGCDQEAVRIIKNMPAWNPGKQKGKPVLVRYSLPVNFALK